MEKFQNSIEYFCPECKSSTTYETIVLEQKFTSVKGTKKISWIWKFSIKWLKLGCRIDWKFRTIFKARGANLYGLQVNERTLKYIFTSKIVCIVTRKFEMTRDQYFFLHARFDNFQATLPRKKRESTLLHTYVLNEFLTADRSFTTQHFWKNNIKSL